MSEDRMGWVGAEGYAKSREVSWTGRGVRICRRPRSSWEVEGSEERRRREVAVEREELICGTGVRLASVVEW